MTAEKTPASAEAKQGRNRVQKWTNEALALAGLIAVTATVPGLAQAAGLKRSAETRGAKTHLVSGLGTTTEKSPSGSAQLRAKEDSPEFIGARYMDVFKKIANGEKRGGFLNCAVVIYGTNSVIPRSFRAAVASGDFDMRLYEDSVDPGMALVIDMPVIVRDKDQHGKDDIKLISINTATVGMWDPAVGPDAKQHNYHTGDTFLLQTHSLNQIKSQGARIECHPYRNQKPGVLKARFAGEWFLPEGMHTHQASSFVEIQTYVPQNKLDDFLASGGRLPNKIKLPLP